MKKRNSKQTLPLPEKLNFPSSAEISIAPDWGFFKAEIGSLKIWQLKKAETGCQFRKIT